MKKYLWWKKYLTIFQMIQFVIVFVRSLLVIFGIVDCGYPRYFSLISASITALFFAMFMKFYSKSYQAKQKLKNNWLKYPWKKVQKLLMCLMPTRKNLFLDNVHYLFDNKRDFTSAVEKKADVFQKVLWLKQ